MSTDPETVRQAWRIPDAFWTRIVPLLPPRKPPLLECYRPRIDDRRAMGALFCVLRRDASGTPAPHRVLHQSCRPSPPPRAGGRCGVLGPGAGRAGRLCGMTGPRWRGLAMDGARTKAPLGEKGGKHPTAGGKLGRCRDTAYDSQEVHAYGPHTGVRPTRRARGDAAQVRKQEAGAKAPQRAVERTQSGRHRVRRVLVRWDKKVPNSLACLHLACAYSTYKQSGLLG